jgi:hypothetical protein
MAGGRHAGAQGSLIIWLPIQTILLVLHGCRTKLARTEFVNNFQRNSLSSREIRLVSKCFLFSDVLPPLRPAIILDMFFSSFLGQYCSLFKVFWDRRLCSWVGIFQSFWKLFCLHLQQYRDPSKFPKYLKIMAYILISIFLSINPLQPNGHYSGRTAQLISRICI